MLHLENFNWCMTRVENYWNKADCLPMVGMYTGLARQEFGKYQFGAGAFILGMGLLAQTCNSKSLTVKTITAFGKEQAVHGILNVVRGTLTYHLGEGTHGMGNILLAPLAESMSTFDPPVFKYGCYLYGLGDDRNNYRSKML